MGKFNLDYEESVLLRSRLGRYRKVFRAIYNLAKKILNRGDFLPETSKDNLREIRDLANGELNDTSSRVDDS